MTMTSKHAQEEIFQHDFDGIQEYDNDLPGWWKMLFYGTIIFTVVYLMYYHVLGVGDSSQVEYLKEMNPNYAQGPGDGNGMFTAYHSPFFSSEKMLTPLFKAELSRIIDAPFEEQLMRAMSKANPEQIEKLKNTFPDIYKQFLSGGEPAVSSSSEAASEPTIAEPIKDAGVLTTGKKVFETQCFTCHGKLGEGGIGPNMTDAYWIHGGKIENIIHTIRKGVPAKGMISWEKTLSPDQINAVASFILLKLQGSNPSNGKAPQGEKAAQ